MSFSKISALVLFLVFLVECAFGQAVESDESLVFVSLVFRHGNRAPLVHYKTDPHKHQFPDGPGQLTRTGKMNMYQKGALLRKMYDGFISPNYKEGEVYITSTQLDRTLMSAQLVLAGFYPPSDDYHRFEPFLGWQPIPVHEDSPDKSFIFGHGTACPRYSQVFYKQINKTTERLEQQGDLQELFPYCKAHCGEEVKTVADMGLLVDTLKSEVADGLKLPDWVQYYYDPTLLGLLDVLMNVIVQTTEQKKLITGPLLKQINDNMSAKVKGKLSPDRKMVFYSGHDFSILGLLSSIHNNKKLIPQPEFGASLAFELYRNSRDEHIVKVKYLRSFADDSPEEISIKDCGPPCYLDKFLAITEYVIPDDWDKECQLGSEESIDNVDRIPKPHHLYTTND